MLTETFLQVPGIGPAQEKKLWDQGTTDWWTALDHQHGLFTPADGPLQKTVRECLEELKEGRFEMTAALLDWQEHWRALVVREVDVVRPLRWLALDIETTGLSPDAGRITAIGLCGHATDFEPVCLVPDGPGWAFDMHRIFRDSDVLLTFNGRSFDLPFISRSLEREAPIFPPFHVDLYPLLKRLGIRGGLKRIQHRLGFKREDQLQAVDGRVAITLWHEHRRGTPGARETLVRYCLEDVVVLFDLARWAYDQAAVRINRPWRCWTPPRVSLAHLPYDAPLIHRLRR